MKLYSSKAKILGQLLLGCLLLFVVVFGVVGIYTGPSINVADDPRAWLFKGIGPVAVVLLVGMQVFWVRRLLDKAPALQVDDRGIDTGHAKYGFFTWKELANVHLAERRLGITRKVYFVVLMPRDPASALRRYTGYTLKRAQGSMKQYGGLMMILQALPGHPRDLGGAIAEYGKQMILANPVMPPVVAGPPVVS
jgi:hypothetical protein